MVDGLGFRRSFYLSTLSLQYKYLLNICTMYLSFYLSFYLSIYLAVAGCCSFLSGLVFYLEGVYPLVVGIEGVHEMHFFL